MRAAERSAEAKTVTRMLSPSEPPSCWETLTRPDAAPASWGETPAIPAEVRGANAMPIPIPRIAIGSAICGK